MPTLEIPSYNSGQNVRPIQQAPLKRGESLQGFKDVEMVLSTGQKIVADLQKAESIMQETQAKTDFKMAVARIQQQAFEDDDFDSADKYKKAIEQAKKESLGKISNGQVRNQVGMDFEYDVQATMLKVQNDFYKKRIANNEVVFTNATQQMLANRVLLDKNSEEYKRSELDYAKMVQAQKESGLLSDEQINKINTESNKNVAENLVYTDPSKARAMIEDDVFNLSPKEKHRLIQESYNVEKQRDLRFKIEKIDKEVDIITNIVLNNETLSSEQISSLVANEQITEETAKAYIDYIREPFSFDAQTDGDSLAILADNIFKAGSKEDVQKFVRSVLRGGVDGKISQQDLSTLMAVAMNKNKAITSADKPSVKYDSKWNRVDRVYGNFFNWAKNIPQSKRAEVLSQAVAYMASTDDKVSEEEMFRVLKDKSNIITNPNRTKYEKGKEYSLPYGNVVCVDYDDSGNPLFVEKK